MSLSVSEITENLLENKTNQGPKRFIFDVIEDKPESNNTQLNELQLTKEDSELPETMPFITGFSEPANYQEGYNSLLNSVLGVYNHVRLLIAGEYYAEFKEVIDKIKIEQPKDCVIALRDLFVTCCDKMPTKCKERKREEIDSVSNIEELLQKAEAKIRIFIRNEQIFRLNFDLLTQRIDEADKALYAAQYEIDTSRGAHDAIAKENAELSGKVKQMEEELKKVQKEYQDIEQKYKETRASLATLESQEQTTAATDRKVPTSQNWDQQLVAAVLKENKATPTAVTGRLYSNMDQKKCWGESRQSSTKYLGTERIQERRANITGTSFLNTSSEQTRKTERSKNSSLMYELKKTIDSHRTALNVSSDIGLNKSTERAQERNTTNGVIFNLQRKQHDHSKSGTSQDHIRVKVSARERKLGEYNDKELSSFLANKTTVQKFGSITNRYNTIQVGPTSTRRSRDSSLITKNNTDQSPDSRSHDSKALRTQGNSQGFDFFSSPYATSYKHRTIENKDERNQNKVSTKTSFLIKNMIAEQLSRKINGNKFI